MANMKKYLAKNLFENALALRQFIHEYVNAIAGDVVPHEELKQLYDTLGSVSKKAFNFAVDAN